MKKEPARLTAGVISSAFVNFFPEGMEREIDEFIRQLDSRILPNGMSELFHKKKSVYRHFPLGFTWCLKHNITKIDVLISSSIFKHLLPYDPFFIYAKDTKIPLADRYDSWAFTDLLILQWADDFLSMIDRAISFAREKTSSRETIQIPSLATNFPNLSNSSKYEPAEELWKRSVIALAACMVAAHWRGIRVIEIIAGSVLDKRVPNILPNSSSCWQLRLFPIERDSLTDGKEWNARKEKLQADLKKEGLDHESHFRLQYELEQIQSQERLSKHTERENRDWKKRLAKGIWTAYVLAGHVLTHYRRGKKGGFLYYWKHRLVRWKMREKVWPDVAVAIELEPEPYRLACNPKELLDLVQAVRDFIHDEYDLFDKTAIETKVPLFNVSQEEADRIVPRIGINLDFGHLAMYFQKNTYRISGGLEKQTQLFLSEDETLLSKKEKENFWNWIFHAHLSDHGVLHNKDQVPLSILPREFYISLFKKFNQKIKEQQPTNPFLTRNIALELEAASTTGEVGAGFHYIVELLDEIHG